MEASPLTLEATELAESIEGKVGKEPFWTMTDEADRLRYILDVLEKEMAAEKGRKGLGDLFADHPERVRITALINSLDVDESLKQTYIDTITKGVSYG